jgi:hypothetical protein
VRKIRKTRTEKTLNEIGKNLEEQISHQSRESELDGTKCRSTINFSE